MRRRQLGYSVCRVPPARPENNRVSYLGWRWANYYRARLYSLNALEDMPLPAMVFAHGGGWCLGSLDVYDGPCRALANATGRVILSVDYRLAPEYPFPTPLHDVYQVLCWASEQAAQIGIDPLRIALGGDSAGEPGGCGRSDCQRSVRACSRTSIPALPCIG